MFRLACFFLFLSGLVSVVPLANAAPPSHGDGLSKGQTTSGNGTSREVLGQTSSPFVLNCPSTGVIFPCLCTNNGPVAHVTCNDIDDPIALQRLGRYINLFQIRYFHVIDSVMLQMPAQVLLPLEIEELHFIRSNISRLSFFDEYSITYPVQKLKKTLYRINVDETRGSDQWDWSSLMDFEELQVVKISGSDFPRLTKWFGSLPVSVTKIWFDAVNMESAASGALSRLINLRTFVINRTPLSSFSRSVLPRPAQHLNTLKIINSHLSSLQQDFFEEMPNLVVVDLRGNHLQTLSEFVFKPISMDNLRHLLVSGNPLVCDCKMQWLNALFRKDRAVFQSDMDLFCQAPINLANERLLTLEEADLQCTAGTYKVEIDYASAPHEALAEL